MDQRTVDRFLDKVSPVSSWEACWHWMASRDKDGYGKTAVRGKYMRAHRLSFILAYGFIPDGYVIDHLCSTPDCVNPAHLEAVTPQENHRRGRAGIHNWSKTHCPQGHPYSPENTYRPRRGGRMCRTCRRAQQRAVAHA